MEKHSHLRILMGLFALAIGLSGCSRAAGAGGAPQAATANGSPPPAYAAAHCVTEQGVFGVGAEYGIHFWDFSSGTSTVIPGTGGDGLQLYGGTVTGLGFYDSRFYYFERKSDGAVDFVSIDARGQDRHVIRSFVPQSGSEMMLGLGCWYANRRCYTVCSTDLLSQQAEQNRTRAQVLAIDLDSGRMDVLLDTGEHRPMGCDEPMIVGVDDSALYYSRGSWPADLLSETDFEALPDDDPVRQRYAARSAYLTDVLTTTIYRKPFDQGDATVLIADQGMQPLRPMIPFEDAFYYAKDTSLYRVDLVTQAVETVYTGDRIVTNLLHLVDRHIIFGEADEDQRWHAVDLDLNRTEAEPVDRTALFPEVHVGDHLVCIDQKSLFVVISKVDYDAGRFDRGIPVIW